MDMNDNDIITYAGEVAIAKARTMNFGAKKGAGVLPSLDANRAYERAMRKQGVKTTSANKKMFGKSAKFIADENTDTRLKEALMRFQGNPMLNAKRFRRGKKFRIKQKQPAPTGVAKSRAWIRAKEGGKKIRNAKFAVRNDLWLPPDLAKVLQDYKHGKRGMQQLDFAQRRKGQAAK